MHLGWRAREEGERAGRRCVCPVLRGKDVSKLSDIGPLPHKKECSEIIDPSPEIEIIAGTGESPGL